MKTQFTPPLANILLTIVGVMLLFSLKTEAQSAVYDPNYNESSFSFSCATDYIKLNTDVCMYNSSYRVMAFVNDNAGTNGDELLLTVIDWNSNMYQFPITPYDVNNNFVSAVTANTSYLWNPDVVIMENSSFTDGVQAIIVFDTDDPNYGAMVISFDVDLVNTPGISFNGGIAEPINFDGSVYDFSSQPKIDGDHQIHEFGIVSIQPYSTSSAAMVSYYGQSGPSYINNTYSILASIPVANYVPINPDIAVGDDINNPTSGLESVISYIDERIGYVHEVNVVRLPLGSTTPSLEYNNTLNSYTGAIGDNVNYPRICCEPHFDPTTTFPMEWSLTVSAMDLSNPPPSHLWSVHCDAPLVTNFIDDQTQNTYGLSENSMPALDWMDILSPNNMGDAFVAWRGIIHPPSLPDENGVYGMMNPYFTTY
ncbi:MAG TPA: hypothetical protein PLP14_02195, partial [Chitinophagaceae bacterium]|nr:hypothetical protein [Chitinophagaceae bacterium]